MFYIKIWVFNLLKGSSYSITSVVNGYLYLDLFFWKIVKVILILGT